MNVGELGVVAAELMEQIEDEFLDKEAVVGVVAVIAEINGADGAGEYTEVRYRCSDPRRWVQAGLFAAAARGAYDDGEADGGEE